MKGLGNLSRKNSTLGSRRQTLALNDDKVASVLTGSEINKKQKLPLWPEWNENDINSEKWEVGGKSKDTNKGKPTSAAPTSGVMHGFEDPDPKFDYPNGIHIRTESFKRPTELFDKQPFIIDTEIGLENFDLITPNEHLHNNEVMRWIISQIHTLWDMCKKEPKSAFSTTPSQMLDSDNVANKAVSAGRLWRPWEHIYAMNKVVKGPFIPAYNPYGKYVVRLHFMGTWRKIIVDDLIPVDDKGVILLPQTSIAGEIWPMILTKALLKIISLDLNPPDSASEINDISVISCFTGWLPEPLPLRFGHMSEVWKFLKETLPKYQWPEEKPKTVLDDEMALINEVSDTKEDLENNASKLDSKSQKSKGKDNASVMEIKTNLPSGKDTKLDKHKKGDAKSDKKGKSIFDDSAQEESFSLDFPEMVVYASFTDLPLNKLSASTEVADRRERLRKYCLNHDFSNPVWITCTRDISLDPPPPPEKIPVWKTIRQKKKHVVPSDEPIVTEEVKPDQWIELKSPYVGYKASATVIHPTLRTNSRYGRIRSRPQSQTNIEGIQEADEAISTMEKLESEPADLSKIKLEVGQTEKESLYKGNSVVSKKEQENTQIDLKAPSSMISSAKDSGKNKASEMKAQRAGSAMDKNDEDLKSIRGGSKLATDDLADNPNNPNTVAGPEPKLSLVEQQKLQENKSKLWMDFDDFFVCFKSIIVFHKPSSYKFNEKYSDLRQVMPHKEKTEKKKDQAAAQIQLAPLFDEKSLKLLFVDSLMPIELIVSFSSLSRWYEQKMEFISDKVSKSLKKSESMIIDAHDTISVSEVREILPLQSGHLMAEPYTWKSLVTGQPSLRIHTTAIRSSYLSLPPGRHVLKFVISAPVGYHINVLSNTKFSLGDEEEIMPKLTDESCRFVDQALHIMKCLSDAIRSFTDPLRQKESLELLFSSMSPLTDSYLNKEENDTDKSSLSKRNLSEIFQASLYEMLRKALAESCDYESAYAWRVFLMDAITSDPLLLREKRPETSSTNRGSAKKIDKKKSEAVPSGGKESVKDNKQPTMTSEKTEMGEDKMEYWKNHTPTAAEHIAAVKIQTSLRGFYVRQIFQARVPGSQKNIQASETLRKTMTIVETNIHENALFLFRSMFKINPNIMEYYSFYRDEWNRISYLDYNGSFPDQTTNNWLILFRDVFYANEQVLVLPKIYCNLNNCLLRVINNDTYKEIPKVFNKVSPYTYSRNKKGYTIMAESRALDQPAGRWRLRLIGSSPSLITPIRNKADIISGFDFKEARDYYVPNENKTILRYKVTVVEDHLTTLQLTTSKPDVYIKFSIYDNGEEVLSVSGKGTALIPVFLFMKDRGDGSSEQPSTSRPASKTYSIKSKTEVKSVTKETKNKRSTSANSDTKEKNVHSRSSSRQSVGPADLDDDDQNKTHKYIVEAEVLKDSWPLSAANWAFVNKLKEDELNDLKIFRTSSKDNKDAQKTDKKGSKPKESKEKESKDSKGKNPKGASITATSRPASSSFDTTKPHWILKWVSDESTSDQIEIKKDTDRAEEIKALKRAWENVEAGRAAKAAVARSNFLKSNLIKADGTPATDDELDRLGDEEKPAETQPTKSTGKAQAQPVSQSAQPAIKPSDDQPKASITVKQRKKDPAIKPILEMEAMKSSQDLITKVDDSLKDATIIEEILLSRPPTPPKPKVFLPPIDATPFVRPTNNGIVIKKDEAFIKEQDKQRKAEVSNFILLKDQMLKFREEERKYRLYQKLKQIEECEALQSKLDMARKEIIEPREAFRQLFLDAERKRLEDLANQEASLASMNQKPDSKDKKKGSAEKGGKKKK